MIDYVQNRYMSIDAAAREIACGKYRISPMEIVEKYDIASCDYPYLDTLVSEYMEAREEGFLR